MVLANSAVDRNAVSRAVVRMEADWNEREFNGDELTTLALGHLNLGSFDAGRKYMQEALQLDPNNVVLASQLNALSIRLDEIARQREADEARPRGKTILVVDDSATVRKLISGKLEKSGHNVINACDGVEALERMSEQVPDLVLLDITMPRMDGYEVCKQIRANPNCSHIPVVMISGKDGFFDKVRGRMAGASGYVTKPFGPETLMRALETYLIPDAPVAAFQPEPQLEPVV
jgi:twitching motility two-component system response regulator PilG